MVTGPKFPEASPEVDPGSFVAVWGFEPGSSRPNSQAMTPNWLFCESHGADSKHALETQCLWRPRSDFKWSQLVALLEIEPLEWEEYLDSLLTAVAGGVLHPTRQRGQMVRFSHFLGKMCLTWHVQKISLFFFSRKLPALLTPFPSRALGPQSPEFINQRSLYLQRKAIGFISAMGKWVEDAALDIHLRHLVFEIALQGKLLLKELTGAGALSPDLSPTSSSQEALLSQTPFSFSLPLCLPNHLKWGQIQECPREDSG